MPENQELFSNRDYIESKVKEMVLGPGYARELIVYDDVEHEIIDANPTRLYSTGVLAPSGPFVDDELADEQEDDSYILEDEPQNADINGEDENHNVDEREDEIGADRRTVSGEEDKDDEQSFRSSHIGLIACVASNVNKIRLEVSYAKYSKLPPAEINRVKIIAGDHYDVLRTFIQRNDNSNNMIECLRANGLNQPFSSYFAFDDTEQTVSLRCPMDAKLLRVIERPVDWVRERTAQTMLKKLLLGQFYERRPFQIEKELDITTEGSVKLSEEMKCYWKCFTAGDRKKYVKVLIKNMNHQSNRGLDYRNCFFQTTLTLTPIGAGLLSYTDPISSPIDLENSVNEYVYRDVINYGKGVGCAAVWDPNGEWIQTSYMPRAEVKKFSNSFDKDAAGNVPFKDICTLRNISLWTELNDDELLNGLEEFVLGYRTWHEGEVVSSREDVEHYPNEVSYILSRQCLLVERLQNNVDFLRANKEALKCFKIANAAMLIQMVVSRDGNFQKNREDVPENRDIYDSLEYFSEGKYLNDNEGTMAEEPYYRPFQLAFLLMNVRSTLVENDEYRQRYVDLIWFPTGGGKTEAYLALTALTIVARRRNSADVIAGYGGARPANYSYGVSVIMRYTLRLLTSQQFERASFLICALEFLRKKEPSLMLGNQRISIGLWVGKGGSPNNVQELTGGNTKYHSFLNGENVNNPFPVAYCPWCGKPLYEDVDSHGYNSDGYLYCLNNSCSFNIDNNLPIYYIDSVVYQEKPTLLFATVDKFAQLYREEAAALIRVDGIKSPDLIIQDELHLISGPLGSTVSLFEGIVEEMASQDGHHPKIIASTATTRNTGSLIKKLYGKNREVCVFPAQGLSYKNNYFSHLEDASLRCHIGLMPTGRTTSNDTETNLTAILLLSRLGLAKRHLDRASVYDSLTQDGALVDSLDLFWSIVLYYNSLKDLGRSSSRASQEIMEKVRSMSLYFQVPDSLQFLKDGLDRRKREFTSREDSLRIKKILTEAQSQTRLCRNDAGDRVRVDGAAVDLVYASNMISVGIDIARWNIMVMVGQPRSTSEYIQSSSRAARSFPGLVFNLMNPNRIREFSLFENYTSFHSAYYKYVEPLSVTPINDQMLALPLWVNMWKCVRNYLVNQQDAAVVIDAFLAMLNERYELDDWMQDGIRDRLYEIAENDHQENVMDSLRDLAPDCYIMIKEIEY